MHRGADFCKLLHLGQKSASDESSFDAINEIIVSAHKTQRFDGENDKTEADFHGYSTLIIFPIGTHRRCQGVHVHHPGRRKNFGA